MISAGLAVLTGSGITARNMSMKFCSHCGHPLIVGIPPLDNMPRHICPNCHMIHYENPKIVVCSIPTWETEKGTSILLCRRAITPRHGFWTLPGGFMENDETTEQAARRETKEEAGADVTISNLFSLMNMPVYSPENLYHDSIAPFDHPQNRQSIELFSMALLSPLYVFQTFLSIAARIFFKRFNKT